MSKPPRLCPPSSLPTRQQSFHRPCQQPWSLQSFPRPQLFQQLLRDLPPKAHLVQTSSPSVSTPGFSPPDARTTQTIPASANNQTSPPRSWAALSPAALTPQSSNPLSPTSPVSALLTLARTQVSSPMSLQLSLSARPRRLPPLLAAQMRLVQP